MTPRNSGRQRSTLDTTHAPLDSPQHNDAAPDRRAHSDPGQVHTTKRPSTNLVLPRSPLIGREHEVAAVQQLLLQERVGLLTLTGPGGIGKTRLALQVAATLLDHFVDGVYFVSLAPITDPTFVIPAIAQTLDVREAGTQALLESLQSFLRDRQLLLVLDNFEQVVKAAPLVATLLAECPRLKLLVTSRATLHLYGEYEFPVPPLALPDVNHLAAAETDVVASLTAYAAVELFRQRALAAKPDFALTLANATAVAEICIALDGLPLAIELAAARVKMFPPPALLARLQQRLTLLTGGPHDLPARQRTLRAEIAWSYDLLTPAEQRLFRWLAVFVDGFTLEAAQAVGNAYRDLGIDVQEGVANLLDHSLLKPMEQANGEPRFGMLETIREYGLEQLTASGEVARLHDQHTDFFLVLAEDADRKLRQPKLATALQRLEANDANLRAALVWSLRDEDNAGNRNREQGLRLVGALSWFWHLRTRYGEARSWSDRALALSDAAERGSVRARALQAAGLAAQMQGDFAYARTRFEESLALWRELGDRWGIAFTLGWLAWAETVPGSPATAHPLAEASLALFRELGDAWGIAFALETLGAISKQLGDDATGRSLLEEAVLLFRELGDIIGMADALGELAGIAYKQGNYETARAQFEEMQAVLATQPLMDNRFLRTAALLSLGRIARQQGDDQAAAAFFAQCLALARDIGNQPFVASACQQLGLLAQQQGDDRQATPYLRMSLELAWAPMGQTQNLMSLIGCIAVAAHQQQWERAAHLAGAVETLCANLDRPFTPLQQADYERFLAPSRARRREPRLAAAWLQGQELTLEQAIQYALRTLNMAEATPTARKSDPIALPSPTYPTGLTDREVEVLRLLTQRLTYSQIAEKLIISRRTVNAHVTSIYSKLGVDHREAAIQFAVDHHLV